MLSAQKHRVIKFGCHDTRRNLPLSTSSKRGESNFLARFEKVYFASEFKTASKKQKFATGREFALDGFGRADLLFMAWTHVAEEEEFTALALRNRLRLTAFEAKIKDWRKGLMQASRYRFFANRSVLVLPPVTALNALAFLPTFRDLNVGLWEFDVVTNRLRKHFTPRAVRPLNVRAREKAVNAIALVLKLR